MNTPQELVQQMRAAFAGRTSPGAWVDLCCRNALPLCDALEAANARADAAEAKVGRLTAAVEYADGCFEAALCEGWLEALGEGEMERLRDIWERRISFARDLFPAALASEAS